MIKHLFKLLWNKKKANALITVEILLSFLVLFTVVTMATLNFYWYQQPLGFEYKNVWVMDIDSRLPLDTTYNEIKETTVRQILLAIKQFPEVENVCGFAMPPYSNSTSIWGSEVDGKIIRTKINYVSEEAKAVLKFHLIEGRWFEPEDKIANGQPIIINEQLKKARFGNESAIGKDPFRGQGPKDKGSPDYRVVGVIDNFKKDGEFSSSENQMFRYLDINTTTQMMSSTLILRMKPGTSAEFEEKLVKQLESVAKNWSFDVKPLEDMRSANFKPKITLMVVVGLIAGFLLLMVALGLIGVLWQNVSRRAQEIGLRRALGSTEQGVYRQIIGELLVLTTFGLFLGSVIIVQFPLLELVSDIPVAIYVQGFVVSVVVMYLLTFFSALYPSWLTMGIEPAEALRYE